ncbi:hypothetical protein N7453_006550 [Penicillium expansum]|nr:hypothetical protein N7453_006550 [Penicillium expansum]
MQSVLDICSSVVPRSWGRRTPPETPNMNTLAGLPVELLLSITDFLPLNDRIYISLCSRRLFAIFNHRTNPARPLGKGKLPVLRRLERDLPKYFVCYIYDQQQCPLRCFQKWGKNGRGLELRYQGPNWLHVYRKFYFLHLQLAMRRFYYGEKFGISTESLSHTQVRTYPGPSSCPEITSLFSSDAQICPKTPGLCLRTQHMMFVHGRKPKLLLSRKAIESSLKPPRHMFICIHVWRRRRVILLNTVVKAYISGEKAPSSNHTCDICAADFRIEVCEYGSDLALILTTWINLGPGLTPDDPRWTVHSWSWKLDKVRLDPKYRKDSPRVCFENVSPQSLEALRSCNLSYLKDQRYKQIMYRIYIETGLWYLPTKSSWGSYWFMP